MLPDPGCYEERYRMGAGAAVGLFIGLTTIGLSFLTVAPWVAGIVIAAGLLALMGPGLAARRMIAFRADYAGITLGAVPGKLKVRHGPAAFIPWADIEKIIVYPADPGGQDANDRVQCLGVQRWERSPALPEGNEPAPGCPVPGVAAGATRRVDGWRLDRERLAAVTAAVAPGVPIVDAANGSSLGAAGSGHEAGDPELGSTATDQC
jgi:hypothetical protein